MVKDVIQKGENSTKKEQTIIDDLYNQLSGTSRKICIVFEDFEEEKIIYGNGNIVVEVYTDKECNNLLKEINVTKEDHTGNSSYERYDILDKGTYYVKVNGIPGDGYIYNYNIFKFEVNYGVNIWKIPFMRPALLPSTGGNGYKVSGNYIGDGENINIKIEIDEDLRFGIPNIPIQMLMEPIAEWDYNKNEYVFKNNVKISNSVIRKGGDGLTVDDWKHLLHSLDLEEESNYSIRATMNNYEGEVEGVFSNRYIYLARVIDFSSDSAKYSTSPYIFAPRILTDADGRLRDTYTIIFRRIHDRTNN